MRKDAAFLLVLLTQYTIVVASAAPGPLVNDEGLKLKIPSNAAKAGGRLRPELQQTSEPEPEGEIQVPLVPLEEISYDYEDEDVPDEDKCEEGMYWHIRGARCVPEKCTHGRDQGTGRCRDPYSGYYGSSFGSYYPGGRSGSWLNRRQSQAQAYRRGMVGVRGRGGRKG